MWESPRFGVRLKPRILLLALALPLLVLPGCGAKSVAPPAESAKTSADSTEAPPARSDPATSPLETVILWVGNQSLETGPVDIAIEVDGKTVLPRSRVRSGQYPWKRLILRLARGRHSLTARSIKGRASLETSFSVTGPRWVALDY